MVDMRAGTERLGRVSRFPPEFFYHIAEPANLPLIEQHGLLSTERLVALAMKGAARRERFLRQHRDSAVTLTTGAIIRDQCPMPPVALSRALRNGLTPADWYRFLNGFVFLWADEDRLNRHLAVFRDRSQAVLVFDARRMLVDLASQLFLSPINSGNARRQPAPRSELLFVPYRQWLSSGWPLIDRPRAKTHAPAEVVIRGHLPLEPYLVRTYAT